MLMICFMFFFLLIIQIYLLYIDELHDGGVAMLITPEFCKCLLHSCPFPFMLMMRCRQIYANDEAHPAPGAGLC